MKRYRLLADIHHNGQIVEAGSVIEVPDDWKPPMRAVRKSHDTIDYTSDPPIDAQHIPGHIVDEPLAVEVKEAS